MAPLAVSTNESSHLARIRATLAQLEAFVRSLPAR
jgi:hypothetical protein